MEAPDIILKLEAQRDCIKELFKRFDFNSDGQFSVEEMRFLIRVLDMDNEMPHDAIFLDTMLNAMDRNNDGLVDIEEFLDWVMAHEDVESPESPRSVLERLNRLAATHVFVAPQDEANLERHTLWELRADDNNRTLLDAGFDGLDDPALLVASVGSSSTQAYDATGFAMSFPVGTRVTSSVAYEELTKSLRERGVQYRRVLLINSIGYQLDISDPRLLTLSQLAERVAGGEKGVLPSTCSMLSALQAAFPDATLHVYNRTKDPNSKRYKYSQVVNDFSEALASEHGFSLCRNADVVAGQVPDAIVDWGGGSFKVYVGGTRVGTELMDANACLCDGDVLRHDRMVEAIREIKLFVLKLLPDARRIFIAQTGKARELAIRQGLRSFSCS